MFCLRNIRKFSALNTKYSLFSNNNRYNLTFPKFCTIKISEAFTNLDNNYKQQQRIYKNDIEKLIATIENEDINEDNYILLLQSCGHLIPDQLPSSRLSLAQKTWQKLINKNIKLTTENYNALLQCYVENRSPISHTEFLKDMKCEPNIQTYNLLLECACENSDLNQAIQIVNLMKERGISATEPVFSNLILCHLKNRDLKTANNILSTMRIAQINLSSKTYTALLRGYVEINEIKLFENTLKSSQSREFNLKQLISILNSICDADKLELLPLIKKYWATKIDGRIFYSKLENLCIHLIYLNKPKIGYELFKSLTEPEIGFVTESDTYCSNFIYEMIKNDTSPEIIINIADDLIKSNKNIYALFKSLEIALRLPNINLSLILLQALFDRKYVLKNHYFWPVLINEAKMSGEQGIFKIFDLMKQYKIPIENETLEVYSLQYIKNFDAELLINKLKQFDLSVVETLSPITVVLLRDQKIQNVAEITTKYKVKLDGNRIIKQLSSTFVSTKDLQSTITILKNIQLKNNLEDWSGQLIFFIFTRSGSNINYNLIHDLLNAYKTNDIKISVQFIDKIEILCKKIKDNNIKLKILKVLHSIDAVNSLDHNNHIPHPRNMNLEELECHLIELRDKKMDTRGVLRKLIQLNSRFGNLERVSELCSEFLNLGYQLSPGMKSSLLDLYLKVENFEKAWNEYKDLKQNYPNFILDEYKIVNLARLLCINNKFLEADMLLQNESVQRKIKGGSSIERNCWKLLDTVAKMKKVKETKTLFNTLLDNNYCTDSNVMLGPLVRVHICNNDKSNAAKEYINCCTKYNKTPLLHELLCYLVQNESSSELIQQVVESSVLIHGPSQTHTTLAAALAETGLNKTLRKLFLDTNLYLSQKLLEQICERWVKENKIHALKNFINAAKGINSINLSVVYYHLMRAYSSNNDCDSVLSLWHELQDKNFVPNDKIKNLVDSLISQNKTIEINKNM